MRWIILLALVFVIPQPVLAALKKCVDDNGMFHYYTAAMPPECQNKATVEMNKLGVVIRTHEVVDAKPDTVDSHEKETMDEQHENQRHDTVLLNTYTSEEEIDLAMARNIHPLELAIAGVEKRLTISKNQLDNLKQQAAEAEKSGNPLLTSIRQDMIPVKRAVAQLTNQLKKNHERINSLKKKFASDRKRFQELKAQNL